MEDAHNLAAAGMYLMKSKGPFGRPGFGGAFLAEGVLLKGNDHHKFNMMHSNVQRKLLFCLNYPIAVFIFYLNL